MPTASIRFTDELYARLKQTAESEVLSISDFVRKAVEKALADETSGLSQDTRVLQRQLQDTESQIDFLRQELSTVRQSHTGHLTEKENQIEKLHAELTTKNQQIEELHRLVAMAQSNTADMARQLESSQHQLEDLRQRGQRSFWRRLFNRPS